MSISATAVLGLFVFGLNTASYNTLQRTLEWRHPSNSRVGRRPARQYIGPGEETITLQGVLLPEITGGRYTLDVLRFMADTGKAWLLMDGVGSIFGMFVIESIDETRSMLFPDGTARRVEFTVKLARVDHDEVDRIGDLVSIVRAGLGIGTGIAQVLKL